MLRLIGDIHGNTFQYKKLIAECEASLQLGDFGFQETYTSLFDVDPTCHRFVPGNHDDYDHLPEHAVKGDFGTVNLGGLDIFFIRGADSVDKQWRRIGISWWEDEQISWESGLKLMEEVVRVRPKIIVSHDCPADCMLPGRKEEPFDVKFDRGVLTNRKKLDMSLTTQILTSVFDKWKPELWVFGHHHNDWIMEISGTTFVCLDELSSLDLSEECGTITAVRRTYETFITASSLNDDN